MSDNKVEEFMKKNPPWFMFDFHPIRFAKKLSKEGEEIDEERSGVMEKEDEACYAKLSKLKLQTFE